MSKRTCIRCNTPFTADNGSRGKWVRFCSQECADAVPPREIPQCTVSGCDNPARSTRNLYCEKHYYRIRRNGTLKVTHPQRLRREVCRHPECGELDSGPIGHCVKHAARIRSSGDPDTILPPGSPAGDNHPSFKGDDVTYSGAHMRVRARRGDASAHRCVDCGDTAGHWSYNHDDPQEKHSPQGEYSTNVDHYSPRCVACHKRFDLDQLGQSA